MNHASTTLLGMGDSNEACIGLGKEIIEEVENAVDISLDLELTCVENDSMKDDNVICIRDEVDHTSFTLMDMGGGNEICIGIGNEIGEGVNNTVDTALEPMAT